MTPPTVGSTVALDLLLTLPEARRARIHHGAGARLARRTALGIDERLADQTRTPWAPAWAYDQPVGHQPMGLHPAVVVIAADGAVLVAGPRQERTHRLAWTWAVVDDRTLRLTATWVAWGGEEATEPPGDLHVTVFPPGTGLVPAVFTPYHDAVAALGTWHAPHGPLARHDLFWGTWNDGIHRTVHHDLVVEEARWLRHHAPQVRWIGLDDGWSDSARGGALDDGSPAYASSLAEFYRPHAGVDRQRFPQGLDGLVQAVQAEGLRSLLWLTTCVTPGSALAQDHPDWLVPGGHVHWIPDLRFLDFSLPAVRDYFRQACATAFGTWGFQGCKLDFWSFGFDQPGVVFRHGGSATRWQHWVQEELRRHIGPDGLLLHCLDAPQGTPLRAGPWDQHRFGPDIDGIPLERLEEVALWGAEITALHGSQRFWIPNADGLGVMARLGDDDGTWRLWAAFLLVSGTWTEIAGRLSRQTGHRRLAWLQALLPWVRHGRAVECPGFDWLAGYGQAPRLWLRHGPPGEVLVAITNWGDALLTVTLDPVALGLIPGSRLVNLIDGTTSTVNGPQACPPRDGIVWRVAPPGAP